MTIFIFKLLQFIILTNLYVLPAKGTDISEEQKDLNVALIMAVHTNRIDDTRALLIKGAHINYATPSGIHRSLHVAAECGYKEILALLLAHGADVDIAEDGSCPSSQGN